MILNICTTSYRDDHLQTIYKSIPKNADIVWHICRSADNPLWKLCPDPRVRLYNIDCKDTDSSAKLNFIFDQIKIYSPNSYFCILDDDTPFHKGMYKLYRSYRDRQFMVIGNQVDKSGYKRLQPTLPVECAIDSGNVLCHSIVLNTEKWANKGEWTPDTHEDFVFWDKCFKHFGIKFTDMVDKTISIYNKFNNKPDTLNYVR